MEDISLMSSVITVFISEKEKKSKLECLDKKVF